MAIFRFGMISPPGSIRSRSARFRVPLQIRAYTFRNRCEMKDPLKKGAPELNIPGILPKYMHGASQGLSYCKKDRGMQKKVLIVDDSHMIRRIVGKILKDDDYEVLIAENGLMGYEMAKRNLPDLVIMDVEMPVMNGLEATSHIKADPATTHIPVLIFTSLGSENDIRKAKEAGGSGFLNKPISKEELRANISTILGSGPKGAT